MVDVTSTAGFWGPSDSKIDFCEESYAVTPYIAEFWNSTSSLVYVFLGILGIYNCVKMRTCLLYPTIFLTLSIIGVGSTTFHGTMRWWGELWDELPMIALGGLFLVGLNGIHPLTSGMTGFYFYTGLAISLLASTIAYVQFQFYEIFLHSFTAMIVVTVVMSFHITSSAASRQTNFFLHTTLAELIVGKVVWSLEHALCGAHPMVPMLHVVWHIFSAFAAYHYVLFLMSVRYEKLGYEAVWRDSKPLAQKSAEFGKFPYQPYDAFLADSKDECSFGSFHSKYLRKLLSSSG
mmetsp:Transcript_5848/g.11593  ORF Transcript_5848/g.11593 Transcript_5848/m.11593 type:complete len:291 (-) Transcript_5848:221-1093(-)